MKKAHFYPLTSRFLIIIAISLATVSITGCATLLTTMTGEEPLDNDHGRRTFGALIEDEAIEIKVKTNLFKAERAFREGNITVVSFNGIVLLAGQLQSDTHRRRAAQIAQKVRHVRKVHNELTVAGPISYLSRLNDTWLTTKVKTRMLLKSGFPGRRVKVVTVAGAVYLMGLLTREEADQAVDLVRRVYGVQRIVKVFEP